MKTLKVVVLVVVFVLAIWAQLYLLKPDTTLQTLKAQAWLPSSGASSSLLSERNRQKSQSPTNSVDLATFRRTEFVESDVVLMPSPSGGSPFLDYIGKKPDGTFVSSSLSVNALWPARRVIYANNWQTLTFDRTTGEVSVQSQLGLEGTIAAILIVALVLAVSFAVYTPEKPWELLFWPVLLAFGLGNAAAFCIWQLGKTGELAEALIFAFFAGIAAMWCFVAYWGVLCEKEDETPTGMMIISLLFLCVGVAVETPITIVLFTAPVTTLDMAFLAGMFAVVAIAINLTVRRGLEANG